MASLSQQQGCPVCRAPLPSSQQLSQAPVNWDLLAAMDLEGQSDSAGSALRQILQDAMQVMETAGAVSLPDSLTPITRCQCNAEGAGPSLQ
jgi:hypothetical protein